MYRNKLSQSLGRPQPDRSACVLKGFKECGLELWKERLQSYAHLQDKAYEENALIQMHHDSLFIEILMLYLQVHITYKFFSESMFHVSALKSQEMIIPVILAWSRCSLNHV